VEEEGFRIVRSSGGEVNREEKGVRRTEESEG